MGPSRYENPAQI